ncbi:MAG: hypothetical protein J6M18_04060 [Actinomycetaceae bacterium]|nr:hypothetical protein [Actinomycetaceae bacterium]
MKIHEIRAIEVSEWSHRAVEHMAHMRAASGALRPSQVRDYIRKNLKRFKVGTPINSRIFVDEDARNWLWMSTSPELEIVDAKIDHFDASWIEAYSSVAGGKECLINRFRDDRDNFLKSFPQRQVSVSMSAELPQVNWTPIDGTELAYLRPMRSDELATYLVLVSNEQGRNMADLNPNANANTLVRKVYRDNEEKLSDGVATPGHYLYSIVTNLGVIGGIWAEVDSSSGKIVNCSIDSKFEGRGFRRAAMVNLADILKSQGVRYLTCDLTPPTQSLRKVLTSVGFSVTTRQAYILPDAADRMMLSHVYVHSLHPGML